MNEYKTITPKELINSNYSGLHVAIVLKNGNIIEGRITGHRNTMYSSNEPKDLFINLHEVVSVKDIKEIIIKK